MLLQFELMTTQLKFASAHCGGNQVFSSILHHVLPNGKTLLRLGKLVGRSVGISSSPSDSTSSKPRSSTVDQAARLQTLTHWIALCGRYLYFAGSQLLLAVDDPAAGQSRGLSGECQGPIQQVSCGVPQGWSQSVVTCPDPVIEFILTKFIPRKFHGATMPKGAEDGAVDGALVSPAGQPALRYRSMVASRHGCIALSSLLKSDVFEVFSEILVATCEGPSHNH
jgi:hypothetical protein